MAACGEAHTVAVLQGGALWAWGRGQAGQIGDGARADAREPALVASPTGVSVAEAALPYFVRACCGMAHSAALTDDGRVFVWGANARAQLGLDDREPRLLPTPVPGLSGTRIVLIAAGMAHTVAVSEAGVLFAWGEGENGQLGHNDTTGRCSPCRVEALHAPVAVAACGALHTLVVSEESGQLLTCGENGQGQLGTGDRDRRLIPVPVLIQSSRNDGAAGGRVSMAAGGFEFSVAVLETGAVYSWGYGDDGQLGHSAWDGGCCTPTRIAQEDFGGEGVVMVACGTIHAAAVTESGKLFTWGDSEDGALGRNGEAPSESGRPRLVPADSLGHEAIVMASCGEAHTCAVTETGKLWVWGKAGLGDTSSGAAPRLVELGPLVLVMR
jgi:alpha-tubulin suppressor-like RCC1 family protein